MRTLSLDRARRLALTSLGLADGRPAPAVRRDVRHLRRVLDAVRVVQLDSVNVLARAHELPFWSRLGPHDRAARDRWLWGSRELFEGWIHVASLAPVRVWPWLHHRRRDHRPHQRLQHILASDPGYLDAVVAEVAERGPLTASELPDPGPRTGPWWGNHRGKEAADHLLLTGRLAVHERTPGFVLRYDLPERVLPARVLDTPVPSRERAEELLLLEAVTAQGLGTAAHLGDHHRLRPGRARAALHRLAARGEVEEVRVAGWGDEPVYLDPRARTARQPRARCLLSPFDPLVWHRARTEALFGFRYRIEIYVPAARRVHGYYVLPLLLGDRLVARTDLKADRHARRLVVRAAHLEPDQEPARVAAALAGELVELATWLGLEDVEVQDRGDLAGPLTRAVRRA